MNNLLELRSVGFNAGEHEILQDVSWTIEPGQHWVILGPNGAGKTTLLRMACGYLWPNAGGEVLRCGQRFVDLRELRKSMGWVSSRLNAQIPPHEPALDTVVSGRMAVVGLRHWGHASAPASSDLEKAQQFLKKLNSSHLAQRAFGVLSQGEQQKVLIARALMSEPLLVFLDEPCAGLDPGARERFLADLNQLALNSTLPSLILVTHHVEEIMPAFDNLLIMQEGRIEFRGPAREGICPARLERCYPVRVIDLIEREGRFWPVLGPT